ncbi:hypothetical protein [Streptomyces sp. NPDC094049]|uniref:hypothetical protein n=1 Tax=Streptomyces sp. NPDC094049 TaxID=3154987 RepID=UPI00332AB1CB
MQNESLVAVLEAERAAALTNQAQLTTVDPAEAAQIAAVYAARLKELKESKAGTIRWTGRRWTGEHV